MRVYHKPLVNWIWGGALLMAIGGAFAISDRRYALAARKSADEIKAARSTNIPATAASSAVE